MALRSASLCARYAEILAAWDEVLAPALATFDPAEDLIAGLAPEQARWKPDPASWSAVEVINHLYDEEREPLTALRRLLRDGGKDVTGIQSALDKVALRLQRFAPELRDALLEAAEAQHMKQVCHPLK